jgi:hypothetical protein
MSIDTIYTGESNVPLSPQEQAALDALIARMPAHSGAEVNTPQAPASTQDVFWSAVAQWGILVTGIQGLLAASEWHVRATRELPDEEKATTEPDAE